MKRLLLALAFLLTAATAPEPPLRTGDIVFHTSRSEQSKTIQKATRSPYSHTGLVEVTKDGAFVIEAVQPVQRIPWARWKKRGGGRVLVMRLPGLAPERADAVVAKAKAWVGRPYDLGFEWSDAKLYCSELVRKAYQRGAGVELGRMERVGDLHLSFVEKLVVAHGERKIPMDRELVTPASIAGDPKLERVFSTY